MKNFFGQLSRIGLLLAAFVLSGCDHHNKVDQSQAAAGNAAVVRSDSELTGEPPRAAPVQPSYPRALPVTLPPSTAANPTPTPTPAPIAAALPPSSESHPTPTPLAAPPEIASSVPAPVPAPLPDSTPLSAASPTPTPSPEANADTTQSAMTPPTPVVTTPPPPAMDENEAQKQVVVLTTSLGRIVIELDDVAAPRTCGNFRKLVSEGFYNHTVFHRVIPHFMIQGGDPNSKSDDRATYGQGDPGYTLPAEIKLRHVAGAVAMARLPDSVNPQRESNGSQFFICVASCPSLDDQYTVFGHVIKGLDTANQIANQPRDQRDNPLTRIEMEAQLETKKQALEESAGNP